MSTSRAAVARSISCWWVLASEPEIDKIPVPDPEGERGHWCRSQAMSWGIVGCGCDHLVGCVDD
jgi:hypothetical protein